MSTYSLTTAPYAIQYNGFSTDCLVYNSGSTTVYLTDKNDATVSGALPLSPSNTVTWNAGTPLYAFTASTGNIIVFEHASNILDIFQLAIAIGQNITGGSTITNTGIATAIYNQTVPSTIASSTLLDTGDIAIFAATPPSYDLDLGLSSFLELFVGFQPNAAAALSTSIYGIDVSWYQDSARLIPMGMTSYYFMCGLGWIYSNGAPLEATTSGAAGVNVRGRYVTVDTHTSVNGHLWLQVFGSNKNIPPYAKRLAPFGDGGLNTSSVYYDGDASTVTDMRSVVLAGVVPIAASDNIYIPHSAGVYDFNMYITTAPATAVTTSIRVSIIKVSTGSRLITGVIYGNAAASTFIPTMTVTLPNEPVRLFVENTTGVIVNLRASLTPHEIF